MNTNILVHINLQSQIRDCVHYNYYYKWDLQNVTRVTRYCIQAKKQTIETIIHKKNMTLIHVNVLSSVCQQERAHVVF